MIIRQYTKYGFIITTYSSNEMHTIAQTMTNIITTFKIGAEIYENVFSQNKTCIPE